ncbi:hypothetical protein [Paracoccus sp. (in: a-proteobacteria)]|uniref:hypothetical protein n=1 Tax=Paracoccus sp. TaxID=267 RepID=UPI0035AD791F
MKQSVFANLFTRQTLIYGDRSSFSITDDEGNRRAQTIDMAGMSISSELSKGIFFYHVGTDRTVKVFEGADVKLFVRQHFQGMKERGGLDVLLPQLLRELGYEIIEQHRAVAVTSPSR